MSKTILKTEEEMALMAEGGKRLASVLSSLSDIVQKKKTNGLELAKKAEELALKLDGRPSFKGYQGYPASVCVSINDEVVHGIPNETPFKEGDLVKLDFGLWYKGLCTDAAITCPVGHISPEDQRLLNVTRDALVKGIDVSSPGNRIGDIGATIEQYVLDAGFQVVRELVGHGVGKEIHEGPQIPNYARAGEGKILEEGMTLALEPMVNVGGWKVIFESDGWTVRTADGKNSAHFEHTIALTSKGVKILTKE